MGFSAFWFSHQCDLNHEEFLKGFCRSTRHLSIKRFLFTGMGKSIALALLKHGAEVAVLERLKDDLQKFKEEVRSTPSQTTTVTPF